MRSKVEKELLDIKERVRRSEMHDWDKRVCYEAIQKLARLLGVGD